jgi:hypothetical protein
MRGMEQSAWIAPEVGGSNPPSSTPVLGLDLRITRDRARCSTCLSNGPLGTSANGETLPRALIEEGRQPGRCCFPPWLGGRQTRVDQNDLGSAHLQASIAWSPGSGDRLNRRQPVAPLAQPSRTCCVTPTHPGGCRGSSGGRLPSRRNCCAGSRFPRPGELPDRRRSPDASWRSG